MYQQKIKFAFLVVIGAVFVGVLFFNPARTPLTAQVLNDNFMPLMSHQETVIGPYIIAIPSCWTPGSPNNTVELIGGNWPTSPAAQSPITIYLRDSLGNTTNITVIPQGHGGSFTGIMVNVASFTPANSPYFFMAQAINGAYSETMFDVPCTIATLTPTPTTVAQADLVISSLPTLVSTPPIIAYEPVTFSYLITNTSNVDITDLFYVDTYFDPIGVTSTTVPISYSVYYTAIDSLSSGTSRVITMTIANGFSGVITNHTVYGMVDSIQQITETLETNNISGPLTVFVTPQPTPTTTATPTSGTTIAGTVRRFTGSNWIPQLRAWVYLVQVSSMPSPTLVAQTISGSTGSYFFTQAIPGEEYTVYACFFVGGSPPQTFVGTRTGIIAPNTLVDIFMMPSTQACPYP
jgi:hypothetical protein